MLNTMTHKISIFKNTMFLVISEQLSRVMNFLQVIILVRYFSKSDYGIWSLTQSLPTMFFVLTDMGITSIMVRRISREKHLQKQCLEEVLFLKFILSVFFMIAVYIFTEASQYEADVKSLIYLSSIAYLIFGFTELIYSAYRSHEKFAFESVVNVIRSLVFLFFTLFVIFFDLKLHGLVLALLVLNVLISGFCIIWYTRKIHSIRFKIYQLKIYKSLLVESLPFAVLAFINPIFYQIDIIMLSQLSTYESVAVYSIAYKIILFLFVIPVALRRALFPRLSNLHDKSPEEYKAIFVKASRYITVLVMPISVGLFLLSNKIILLLFSSEYTSSILPLKIMAVCLVFFSLRSIFAVTLFSSNLEYPALFIFGAATVLNGVLDYMLIPKFDFIGASIASLISEIAIFLGYYYYIRKKIFIVKYLKTGLKIGLASAIMGICVVALNPFSLFLQIPIGAAIYMIAIYLFDVLNNEDYLRIKRGIKIEF